MVLPYIMSAGLSLLFETVESWQYGAEIIQVNTPHSTPMEYFVAFYPIWL